MSLSDPIADMLTRVRNGVRIKTDAVNVRRSKVCQGVANTLKEEGYISGFDVIEDNRQGLLRIVLKYDVRGEPAIATIDRASRPGRRIYRDVAGLPRVMNGLGVAIVSTSRGILSDRQCREQNVGGELLCTVS